MKSLTWENAELSIRKFVWVSCIATVCALCILWIFHPHSIRPYRSLCKTNLRLIGLAIQAYCSEHNGYLPTSLSALHPKYVSESVTLLCPCTHNEYIYLRAEEPIRNGVASRSEQILACDAPGNHGDGSNVLFLDGHVEWRKFFIVPEQKVQSEKK
ncbi:MAG: H-X9-DG-CTERM domain-containing protein [Planctomycetota bacterium]